MVKYKLVKMNVGHGDFVYTVNWVDGDRLVPTTPIKYYKTRAGALRGMKRLMKR